MSAGTLVIGQFGAASSSATNSMGTLNIADTATLNAATVVVGGNNAGSAVDGVINLNGGTIATGSIRKGSSSLTPGATSLVLNANGGTIKMIGHANNSNFFQNLFVNLGTGGLKFDSGDNFGTINLTAGFHDVEFVMFETTGADTVELYVATTLGTFTSLNHGSFQLLEAALIPEPAGMMLMAQVLLGAALAGRRQGRGPLFFLARLGIRPSLTRRPNPPCSS